ncbi:helix-turn-helix transcriptional regulator [Rhodococcoides kyotonense]|uniref:Helix-turn-helix domain-containing protein n=1 Tax=Rhodococcoides kyotonense TaxID=398843 RepID=A0A239ESI6_9NOCA|nr:helix-turn-helix transcriptional regulator [Rhodococcus kyotonensis]SNS47597.1 Helix-turn-helix domain-containing protein [Rhodococcus kyotonensis]
MTDDNDLGQFLRAQRARITPVDVGLPLVGSRRVAGLRREEVAVLAGVSVDYYARLEQGRERAPAAQMMNAICVALHMGIDSRRIAFRLARLTAPQVVTEAVDHELQQMLDNLPTAAAYVVNPAFRVLAANRVATALIGADQYDQTFHYVFTHPAAHHYFLNWDTVAQAAVSSLRSAAAHPSPHPEVTALIDRLGRTGTFAAMWSDPNIAGVTIPDMKINHPDVGRIYLSYRTFDVRGAPGQQLIVATALAGSPSADALALLGTIDATRNLRHPEPTNGTS